MMLFLVFVVTRSILMRPLVTSSSEELNLSGAAVGIGAAGGDSTASVYNRYPCKILSTT